MRVLCTADIHIGRRSSRIPASANGDTLSCSAAWGRIVDLALKEKVDLVAVSGDVVDRANRFYEAAGPLQEGLRRLAHAGIVTALVAGNHDFDVLPWMVEGLGPESVRLLGKGGSWERFTLERGGETLHVDGWSFPEGHCDSNPAESYSFGSDGVPVLGLLHADLDQPTSHYAPVSLAELQSRAPALWLLGHVHAPRLVEQPGSASVLYPGSPQAMDPGEAGEHGVWIAEIGPGRNVSCWPVPLSSVRYDAVEVNVEDAGTLSEVDARVVEGVGAVLQKATEKASELRYLSCRVRLTGRTPIHRQLADRPEEVWSELDLPAGEAKALVEKTEVKTAPARDIEALAGGKDAPALLARLIQSLDSADPAEEHRALLRDADQRVKEVKRAKPYLRLVREAEEEGGEEGVNVEAELREQAALLLDELLAQKEADA